MIPSYVKSQPRYFKYLPWLSRQDGSTILNTIYLRNEIFEDLKNLHPNPTSIAVLEHEITHYKRIKQQGNINFSIKYLFSGVSEKLLAFLKPAQQWIYPKIPP